MGFPDTEKYQPSGDERLLWSLDLTNRSDLTKAMMFLGRHVKWNYEGLTGEGIIVGVSRRGRWLCFSETWSKNFLGGSGKGGVLVLGEAEKANRGHWFVKNSKDYIRLSPTRVQGTLFDLETMR